MQVQDYKLFEICSCHRQIKIFSSEVSYRKLVALLDAS